MVWVIGLALGWAQAQEVRDVALIEDYPFDWSFISSFDEPPHAGDFNGDGLTDVLRPSPLASFVFSSDGVGAFEGTNVPYGVANFGTDRSVWRALTGDFTGDGSDDLMWLGTDRLWLHESNTFGPAFSWHDQSHPNGWRFTTSDLAVVGDFNGDGVQDVLRPRERQAYLLVGRGYTNFDGGGGVYSPPAAFDFASGSVRAGAADVDGDGADELLAFGPGYIRVVEITETSARPDTSFTIPNGWLFSGVENTPLLIGDFNDDGRDDVARFSANGIYTFLTTETGWDASFYALPNGGAFPANAPRAVGDFNGDGRMDLARRITGRTFLYLADGVGSWSEVALPVGDMPSGSYMVVGDVDDNGIDDLIFPGAIELGTQRFFVATEPDVSLDQVFATALDSASVTLRVSNAAGAIAGVSVAARLEDAFGTRVAAETRGVTDSSGTVSLRWSLDLNVPTGNYSLIVDVESSDDTLATSNAFDIEVAPALRTVSIPSLLSATYGDRPFLLPIQAPSGTVYDIQTSGDCTNNFDQILTTGAGFCTVTATVEGDAYYGPASADGFFSILPAPLTIAVADASRTYGDAEQPPVVQPLGLVGEDTLSDLTGTLVVDAPDADVGVGSYPLSAQGLTSDDYDITYAPGVLTVEPRPLVVSATSTAVAYGTGALPVALTYQGFAQGESEADLDTLPTVSHDAGDTPDAGNYVLRVTPGLAGNYTIIGVDGEAVVYPAPLLVDVADAIMVVGEPVPEPVITYLGFRYTDGPELFNPAPVVTVTAPSDPPPGAYERDALGADHPNYQTLYDDGLLLVLDGADVPDELEAPGCSHMPVNPVGVLPWLVLLAVRRRRSR